MSVSGKVGECEHMHALILYEALCNFSCVPAYLRLIHYKAYFCVTGLDSDESCEGTSEASFKDAVVDAGAEKNSGTVQENGIKKRR